MTLGGEPPGKRARAEKQGVLVLDIGPFLEADRGGSSGSSRGALPTAARAVAQAWREAFAEQGFVQITGHGVPDPVIEAAYDRARAFFALPEEAKKRCDLGKGYGAGGFTAQGGERVSATAIQPDGELLGAARARPPDRVESMVVLRRATDPVPKEVENWQAAVHTYHDELVRLLRTLMRLTACSLDLPLDFFEPYFFGPGGVGTHKCVGECSLRLAHYPAFREGEDPEPGQLRYGEHTDYTGFTILWQDHNNAGPQTAREGLVPPDGGLQVRLPDGSWTDCPPVAGAFTVNAGDLIQTWTNDVFLSNTHRVLNPPPGDRTNRISMVFFTGPSKDCVVEALPTCHGPDRPARYPRVTSGQHLAKKLAASKQ